MPIRYVGYTMMRYLSLFRKIKVDGIIDFILQSKMYDKVCGLMFANLFFINAIFSKTQISEAAITCLKAALPIPQIDSSLFITQLVVVSQSNTSIEFTRCSLVLIGYIAKTQHD